MGDKTIVLAVVSDLHCGSTLGLCPPLFELDDGGTYQASAAQKWLWHCWLDYCGQVEAKVKQLKARLVCVVNGDVVEGVHHNNLQVITNNETTMMRLAYKVLEPMVMIADDMIITRGTSTHDGQSNKLTEKVADDIMIIVRENDSSATFYHLLLSLNGAIFDIAHHGSLGRLPWTKPNSVNRIAASVILNYYERNQDPPNVVIRSHLHQYADTGDNYNRIRVISTPAWQLVTGYVYKVKPGAIADIGGLIFTCWQQGNYRMELARYRPKPQEPVRIDYG